MGSFWKVVFSEIWVKRIRVNQGVVCWFDVYKLVKLKSHGRFHQLCVAFSDYMSPVHLVLDLESLHLIQSLWFFSKMQKKIQLVVWSCPVNLAWSHTLTFCKKYLCSENHKFRINGTWIRSPVHLDLENNLIQLLYFFSKMQKKSVGWFFWNVLDPTLVIFLDIQKIFHLTHSTWQIPGQNGIWVKF